MPCFSMPLCGQRPEFPPLADFRDDIAQHGRFKLSLDTVFVKSKDIVLRSLCSKVSLF